MEPSQVYIRDIAEHVGKTVTLKGWLYNFRKSGKLRFLQVRDGTGTIHAELTPGGPPLVTLAALTGVSKVAGMFLVNFDVTCTQGDTLVYTWTFGASPTGSTATITRSTTPRRRAAPTARRSAGTGIESSVSPTDISASMAEWTTR